ncbi:nuclear transport factor 2 family protein [Streptomyces sp. NPDC004051]
MTESYIETADAAPALVERIRTYQDTKTSQNTEATMEFFSTEKLVYGDATLGWHLPSHDALKAVFADAMPKWGKGRSYATRVLGHERSAIVFVTDTPELFGSEIRAIAAVDFKDGKIVRFVDYWDGRAFGADAAAALRVPADSFPSEFGEGHVRESTAPAMRAAASGLVQAMDAGDTDALSALIHEDAHFEDLTLRVSLRGRKAVVRFLAQAKELLPYASGAAIRHTVGGETGGGFEWTNGRSTVARGITAVQRRDGQVSELVSVWDGTLLADSDLDRLISPARA